MEGEQINNPPAPVSIQGRPAEISVASHAGSVHVGRFYDSLHEAAVRLANNPLQDQFSFAASIVIAGTAAESAVGVTLNTIVTQNNLGAVAEAAIGWINQYNLRVKRIQRTWNAITGDTIESEPFWPRLMDHVAHRNEVVHTGLIDNNQVTREQADESIKAVRELLDHIKQVLVDNGLPQFV